MSIHEHPDTAVMHQFLNPEQKLYAGIPLSPDEIYALDLSVQKIASTFLRVYAHGRCVNPTDNLVQVPPGHFCFRAEQTEQ
jgi:hypothetical protein